ncbi:MAG: porin [Acidobacteria bacterium]|nr:porin [Acidobacteriota bacterium]
MAFEILINIAGTGSARAQPPIAAKAGGEAERLAALEEKIKIMEERLEFLESKLAQSASALVATNGSIPAAALGIQTRPSVLSAAAASLPASAIQSASPQVPAAPFVSAGPEGFSIQSPEGDFRLGIRYQVHADGRFAVNRNEEADPNTFYLRRTQPILTGTLYRRFNFQLLTDFGSGRPRVNDAYIDTIISPALKVRVGKFKGPVGIERLRSGMALPLMERALPTQLVPNRDLGLQLYGDLAEERLSYAVGVFNGVPDGGSTDGNTDDHKDLDGRLMLQPFVKTSFTSLAGLSVGVGGSYGDVQGSSSSANLPSYSSTGQREFFEYRSDGTAAGTVVADGVHYRLSPQGYYYAGPFGLMGEYVQSVQKVRRGSARATMNHASWQVMTSYVLTGENGSYAGVNPAKPFDPAIGNWGAFEVATRYASLSADQEAFPSFADPAKSARQAKAWSLGLNWYLNRNVKLVFAYEQTDFEGATPGVTFDNEKLFQQRFQLRF